MLLISLNIIIGESDISDLNLLMLFSEQSNRQTEILFSMGSTPTENQPKSFTKLLLEQNILLNFVFSSISSLKE